MIFLAVSADGLSAATHSFDGAINTLDTSSFTPSPESSPDQQWVVSYYDLLGIQREMSEWENPQATCGKIDLF